MRQDLFGQTTTIHSTEALSHWNATQRAFLAHGADTATHLAATLEADPRFVLGHCVKGFFLVLLGRRELVATARESLATAKDRMQTVCITARERLYLDALEALLAERPTWAINALEQVLDFHPADTLAMKLSHAIRFLIGDRMGMRGSVERLVHAYEHDHPGRGYLLGCHAFALEETGEYARASSVGRMGLAFSPDDAWGLHAVAHVYDMTGNSAGGVEWLEGREGAWAHCNNFRYHVWWHKALMHLDLGEIDTVFALYDEQIRADKTDDYRDISNATSLLSRLELEGINVGDRWDELADLSEKRTEDGCLIFADLHYLLALVGGCRERAKTDLVQRIHRAATEDQTEMSARMASPGLATAVGLEAFGEGDYKTAFANLSLARKTLQLAGGSHAQRDIFERLTIDSGIRGGYFDDAYAILRERTARRAGREDSYAAARFALIEAGRQNTACPGRVPA